jgi:hypothetical protein
LPESHGRRGEGKAKAVASHSGAVHECGVSIATSPVNSRRFAMHLTTGHIAPVVALIAGILILIMPRLLNYIVAFYLIVTGVIGLNGIYHFMR